MGFILSCLTKGYVHTGIGEIYSGTLSEISLYTLKSYSTKFCALDHFVNFWPNFDATNWTNLDKTWPKSPLLYNFNRDCFNINSWTSYPNFLDHPWSKRRASIQLTYFDNPICLSCSYNPGAYYALWVCNQLVSPRVELKKKLCCYGSILQLHAVGVTVTSVVQWYKIRLWILHNVPFSYLKSKGTYSQCIATTYYCTGSGMLLR